MKSKEEIDLILEKHLPKRYYGHEARKNAKRAMEEYANQFVAPIPAMERERIIELLTKERTDARNIAYSFYDKYSQEAKSLLSVGGETNKMLADRRNQLADIARQIGNAISGSHALSGNETIKDRIKIKYASELAPEKPAEDIKENDPNVKLATGLFKSQSSAEEEWPTDGFNRYEKAPAEVSDDSKDWTEDFFHENGNYRNKCIFCKEHFNGHKRRVICKKCDKALQDGLIKSE